MARNTMNSTAHSKWLTRWLYYELTKIFIRTAASPSGYRVIEYYILFIYLRASIPWHIAFPVARICFATFHRHRQRYSVYLHFIFPFLSSGFCLLLMQCTLSLRYRFTELTKFKTFASSSYVECASGVWIEGEWFLWERAYALGSTWAGLYGRCGYEIFAYKSSQFECWWK